MNARAMAAPCARVAALTLTLLAAGTAPARPPERFSAWPDPTALTLAPGRLVLGVLGQSAWGLHPRIDLRLHPLSFWVLPHAEVRLRWLDAARLQLSTAHRVSYPTPFLALVAREGSGGLLPPTTDVPHALEVESDVLGSLEWHSRQWVTLRAGAAFALVGAGDDTLLDFPILYQRFAALYAPVVPRLALGASGAVARGITYAAQFRHYWLPLDALPLFHASEYSAFIWVQLGQAHRLGAGGLLSAARLPVGFRSHFLPYIDYQLAF